MENKKNRILAYAFQRFVVSGFSGVTMEEIARGCGVGKATIYKYYPSKENLMLSCVDFITVQVEQKMEAALGDPELTVAGKLNALLGAVLQAVSRANAASLADIRRSLPEAYEKIERNRKRLMLAGMTRLLNEAKEKGIVEKQTDTALVTMAMIGAVSRVVSPDVMQRTEYSPRQLLSKTVSLMIRGCLTDYGRRTEKF